ncbi:uncharacterized protein [Eleutherodactylus coqui]|uniref:uncharacterized protein n=1 Tax=Eleutherodactylus coqui TaxID=57060 RepID=UPI003462F824
MMRLSILVFCCFHGTCWTSDYCIHQPKTLYVKEGESVTIPCSYTNAEDQRGRSQITVTWGKVNGIDCKYIKNITDEYKDRISAVHHPDDRTASITIRGLKAADGITFCCRASIFTDGHEALYWYHPHGTSLTFADGRWVTQMEELIAVPGEEMIIPCHYPLETLGKALPVSWYSGYSELCALNKNKIHTWTSADRSDRYSLVNVSEDVSLRIHSVKDNESPQYCCRVDISYRQITQSRFGTELTFAGKGIFIIVKWELKVGPASVSSKESDHKANTQNGQI